MLEMLCSCALLMLCLELSSQFNDMRSSCVLSGMAKVMTPCKAVDVLQLMHSNASTSKSQVLARDHFRLFAEKVLVIPSFFPSIPHAPWTSRSESIKQEDRAVSSVFADKTMGCTCLLVFRQHAYLYGFYKNKDEIAKILACPCGLAGCVDQTNRATAGDSGSVCAD